jgi:RES domain-containing protein
VLLWRISNHDSLNGEGGWRAGARWHSRGRPIVYCTQSPAAALIELLVRLELSPLDGPAKYRLLRIAVPDDVAMTSVDLDALGSDWPANRRLTQSLGDAWLEATQSTLLSVPSAVVPHTWNVLVNPAHPDAKRVTLAGVSEHALDARLLR